MINLSLAMIVRNEEGRLRNCLASVANLVDEIIVVDTGSTDSTVTIATSFGARIGHFPWVDDFAAARNKSLRLCTGNWVLILDADEAVDSADHPAIREACAQDRIPAFFMTLRNYFLDSRLVFLDQAIRPNDGRYDQGSEFSYCADFQGLRLCRRFQDLCFEGRIHELLVPYFNQRHLPIGNLEAVIHHFGKVDLAREEKKKIHYLRMARDQVDLDPTNAQSQFNLMTQACTAQEWELAIASGLAFLALQARPPETVLTTLAFALQEEGRYAEAMPYLKRVLLSSPKHPLALMRLPISLAQTGHAAEALKMLERAIRLQPSLPAPRMVKAGIQTDLGQHAEALATLKEGIAACPKDPALRVALIKLDLRLGQEAQAALDAWDALKNIPRGGEGHWHALVAGFLLNSGETAKGRRVLEQGLKLHPTHASLLRLWEVSDET